MKNNRNIAIENARLIFRNFKGEEGKFNPKGNRNFCVLLDEETATAMLENGWNVRFLNPKDEGDDPQAYLQVGVKFNNYPPKVVLITSRGKSMIGEGEIDILDWADIKSVDLIIRPYPWEIGGKTGVKAYLKALYVTLVEDEFEFKYADVPDSAQNSREWV